MRILHVWDQAGVAGCMAKYQRMLGHDAHVVKIDGPDSLLIDDYYQTEKIIKIKPKKRPRPAVPSGANAGTTKKPFSKRLIYAIKVVGYKPIYAMRMIRFANHIRKLSKEYDIVHIHSSLLTALFLPFKPKILEFHGDDIRTYPSMYWKPKIKFRQAIARIISLRTEIYASTPDIIQEHKWVDSLIENPVDTELFMRKNPYKPGTAFFFENWYEDPVEAEKFCQKNNLKLTIRNRLDKEHVFNFIEAPSFYEQYEYFIDRRNIHSLSKTALECLALGTKVVVGNYSSVLDGENIVLTKLDKAHLPEEVAKKTLSIYENVLSKKSHR